jgi:hypothetical protein
VGGEISGWRNRSDAGIDEVFGRRARGAELASREIDFLKIRTVQDRDTYLALNKAANSHGIQLVGHVSGVPPEVVLDAGQDGVDHNFYPSLEGKPREERLAVFGASYFFCPLDFSSPTLVRRTILCAVFTRCERRSHPGARHDRRQSDTTESFE